jgi:hypothetical protein
MPVHGSLRAMRMQVKLATAVALFALSCARPPAPASTPKTKTDTAPAAKPAANLVDHEGDSTDTAVIVPADAPEEGVRFENDWMFDRIGRFRRLSQGTGTLNGRRYDVIEVETPSGEKKKFFFDITENWNNWKPPSQ